MLRRTRKRRKKLSHILFPAPENNHHPHALRGTVVLPVLTCVLVLQLGFFAYQFTLIHGGVNIASILPGAIALLSNQARAESNSVPLELNDILSGAAQKKADDMARHGYFAHKEPSGEMPWHWFTEAGYDYAFAGENLAVNFTDTEQLVDAWLASPSHRDNILKPQYRELGVGMATGTYKGREAVFVVQFFGARKNSYTAMESSREIVSSEIGATSDTATEVLGQETSNVGAVSALDTVKASPRTYMIRALYSLIILFVALLAFSLIPSFQAHRKAVINGFFVISVLVFFWAFQDSFFGAVELSDGSQSAAASSAMMSEL